LTVANEVIIIDYGQSGHGSRQNARRSSCLSSLAFSRAEVSIEAYIRSLDLKLDNSFLYVMFIFTTVTRSHNVADEAILKRFVLDGEYAELLVPCVAMRVRTDYIYSIKPDSTLGTSSLPKAHEKSLSLTTEKRPIRDRTERRIFAIHPDVR
jgi:hypothetical protein